MANAMIAFIPLLRQVVYFHSQTNISTIKTSPIFSYPPTAITAVCWSDSSPPPGPDLEPGALNIKM